MSKFRTMNYSKKIEFKLMARKDYKTKRFFFQFNYDIKELSTENEKENIVTKCFNGRALLIMICTLAHQMKS